MTTQVQSKQRPAWNLATLWRRLTEPAAAIREPERRRRVRLLSSLLLVLILLGVLGIVLTPLDTRPALEPTKDALFYNAVIAVIVLAIAYSLSRTTRYTLAAALTVSAVFGSIFVSADIGTAGIYLHYLILGVVIGSLFFSWRGTALVLIATFVGTILLSVFASTLSWWDSVDALYLVVGVGLLLVVSAAVRERDLEQIEQQSRALSASEMRFRLILDSAGEGILGLDLEGKHTFVNPAAARMLGYAVEELVGKPGHLAWHHTKADGTLYLQDACPIYAAFKDGTVHRGDDEIFWRKDGASFPVEYTSTPIREGDQIVGAVATFRDITERKQAEDALRQSRDELETRVAERTAELTRANAQLQIELTERKQAEERICRESARAEALARVAARLNAQLDLDAVLNAVCEETVRALNVPAASLNLYDERRKCLYLAAGNGLPPAYRERHRSAPRALYDAYAQRSGPIIVIPDAQRVPDLPDAELYAALDIRTIVVASMLREGQLVGSLNIFTFGKVRHLTDDELALLKGFADQAAQAITNARLFAASQQRAAEMTALRETALDLVSHLETKPLLETIIRRATDLLGATGGVIYQWEEPAQQLRCTISHALSRDYTNVTLKPGEGMAGRVYQTGQPLVVNDYAHWEGRAAHLRDIPSRAVICAPILWQGQVIGTINVNDESGARAFDDRDVRLLSLFANQAATAIENARLYAAVQQELAEREQAEEKLGATVTELEQHNREITLLNEMGDLLQTCRTVEEASAVVAQFAQKLFPKQSGALCLIAASRNLVEAIATWGAAPPQERVFTPDDCWALRRGQTHRVTDPHSGLLCRHVSQSFGSAQDAPFGSAQAEPLSADYMCVPMMAQGETLGVLHLQSGKPSPSQTQEERETLGASQQQLAVTLAEHVALALANLKLRETLRQQAIRDPLTGLFNRRYMEETLERELRRAERRQAPLGVIMFDLDHFKKFNDTFGHAAGDIVLREIGAFLHTRVRVEDIACRYGGEEFVVILPDASLEDTLKRAEQLRVGIKGLNVRYHDQALGAVAVSLGVAVLPEHGSTTEAILKAADAALYRAKREGRDRVVVA